MQSAATAPVGASDTAPNKTAGIVPDGHIDSQVYALIEFLLFKMFLVFELTSRFATSVQRLCDRRNEIATRDLRTEWSAQSDDLRSSARSLDELLRLQRQQPISGLGQSRRWRRLAQSGRLPKHQRPPSLQRKRKCSLASTLQRQLGFNLESASSRGLNATARYCNGPWSATIVAAVSLQRPEMLRQAANRS